MADARRLYIHETTSLRAGGLARFTADFSDHYQPAMQRLGARLFGHWRGHPFNSHWPEITTIWEIDGMAHFGALGEARVGSGETADAFAAWDELLEASQAKGEGRLCYGNDDIRPLADLKAENFRAAAVLQEVMTTKSGQQREYLHQLRKLFVPWSEAAGNRWLGSFVSVTRDAEVIHYWAMQDGLAGFGSGAARSTPEMQDMLRTWMATAPALRESWDDSILTALPQHPLMGEAA